MKMCPYGTRAFMKLDYAIYDGLEIILKSLKMLKKSLCRHSMVQMMMMDESVIVSSVICLLLFWCVHTFFLQMVLKEVKTVNGGLTTIWFECDGFERSQFKDIIHCVCLRWFWKQPILFIYTMVLKWVNFDAKFTVLVSNGLERSHLWVLIFSWALTLACHCIL